MIDRLVALETRRVLGISDFDVPMLDLDDFHLQPISTMMFNGLTECDGIFDLQAQEDLATLCIARVRLCVCISRVLTPSFSSLVSGLK